MAKALRQTQIERKEISDAKMLEAAVDLIVERGAGLVTLKDVGEKAGYSRGLAGYRFGNREGLFDFVLRSVGDEWLGELTQVTANSFGYKAIAAALDAHIKFCEDAPKHVEAFYRLWFDSIAPESQLKGVILGIHQRRRGDVVSWIEQAVAAGEVRSTVDAGMLADHFTASVSGIVYHWMTDPDNLDEMRNLHEALKQVMHSMLRG
jgi:AcrR family transcriptional regulator